MDIMYVQPDTSMLEAVQALGDRHSNFLGFLPASVFVEFARNRQIIAAVSNGSVVGYVAFAPVRRMVKLVHLCVAEESRRNGVASALVERLSKDFREHDGLTAHCRIDFPADALWRKLGFIPVRERPGRSKKGSVLRVWVRPHDHPTLFSGSSEGLPRAVLDACLAYDLQDPDSPKTREARALLGDWLADDVELAVTDELFHEINRNPDPMERKRRWEFASSFERIAHDRDQMRIVQKDLEALFPAPRSESDESDWNQISMAIAGEAEFFLTRDRRLHAMGPEITHRWGILLMRPSELVGQSYEEKRKKLYRPARLAGTPIAKARGKVAELDELAHHFLAYGKGETKAEFNRILRDAIANPEEKEILVFRERDGTPIGLNVLDYTVEGLHQIRLLRTTRSRGADVVARHLLWYSAIRMASTGSGAIILRDEHYPEALQPAFESLGFQITPSGWAKITMEGIWAPRELAKKLRCISFSGVELPFLDGLAAVAEQLVSDGSLNQQLDLELAIWPGKIEQGILPTFLVPIRPYWASQLFEERIAGYDIFGASPGLILKTENVYYRAARGPGVRAPSRVLWYVTEGKRVPHTKQVAGCSYIREVMIGPATEVFSTFERLGVYAWEDVLRIAQDAPTGDVMAFRFSHTELFKNPIPYEELKKELENCAGTTLTVRGPRVLPEGCFEVVYRRGEGAI